MVILSPADTNPVELRIPHRIDRLFTARVAKGSDDILRSGADAELASPYTDATADVIVGITPLMTTESTLIDMICNPRNRPYLSVVGVSAKLKINMLLFGLLQVVGLVVKQDAILLAIDLLHQGLQRRAIPMGVVVAPDDAEVTDVGVGILQEMDARLLKKLLGFVFTAETLVIADTGIDWCFQP